MHDTDRPKPAHRFDGLLDWSERAIVLAFFGWLVVRILAVYATKGSVGDLILLSSEGLVVLLVLIRRTASDVSRRPTDWLLAFSATTAPLLVQPTMGQALLPQSIGVSIMLAGMVIQVHAKLVLGRSMGLVAANRGLKLEGPYRYLRHPMYAGYLLTHVGFLMMNPTGWNLAVYSLCYALQIPRLLAEERLLCRDPRYAKHIASVRYRLFPGLF
ncbi:MAG: methyltransferase [Thermoguttaceae bacterium]